MGFFNTILEKLGLGQSTAEAAPPSQPAAAAKAAPKKAAAKKAAYGEKRLTTAGLSAHFT